MEVIGSVHVMRDECRVGNNPCYELFIPGIWNDGDTVNIAYMVP